MINRYSFRLLALWLLLPLWPAAAQTTVKKVVLQGFWWDYYNDNYRFQWAAYLTELAPRLKSMGIDAVWIPPTPKNKDATNDVGYSPFDHYDLGDKFQKKGTGTRFGTKDEFLRMVAVLHANGIEVVQDVVLNHIDGAGDRDGNGGYDPDSYSVQSNGGYKNFRYSCFGTPVPETSENGPEYLNRQGRWVKNYPNFHPHLGHNTTSGEMAAPYFGPDFCYGDDGGGDGYGPSSNATYNPAQSAGYTRNQARSWAVWLKKQTGVDGFRWDAVKHFSYAAQQDISYNLKYNAGWASAGETMFNVGEYVGEGSTLDDYVNGVKTQNNGADFLMGTFDFGLRKAIQGMVTQNQSGSYYLGDIVGAQQNQRVAYYAGSNTYVHRTVPFVNNHDTFRPQVDATGNYIGWNTGSELPGFGHIDPFEPRLSAAYAVAFAVDGNPQVFFEDLFNVGGTGKRWSHLPTSTTDLPVRDDLVNLLWCHQNLHFKDGAYKVPYSSADHLVIERSTKALIGINDNWNTWQSNDVETDFAVNTQLKDYSGANGSAVHTVYLGNDGKKYVNVNTPPCNGTALQGRRGYSVWAPVGQDNNGFVPARFTATTQEWEMADDLGDLNCQSLGQGGRLPDNSTNRRLVGKIYAQAGQPLTYELYPEAPNTGRSLTIGVYDLQGNLLSSAAGDASVIGTYTPSTTGWLVLKVRNTAATYAGQRCFVKATYTAPAAVDTRATPATTPLAIWTGNNNSADGADCRNWESGVLPSAGVDVRIPAGSTFAPTLGGLVLARNLTIEPGATLSVAAGSTLRLTGNFVNQGAIAGGGTVEMAGTTTQTIGGTASSFANLTINNPTDVTLLVPTTVTGTLTFSNGHLVLGDQNLTLAATATVAGADAGHYIVTKDQPASSGFVVRTVPVSSTAIGFPVGTSASYTPLSIRNTGSTADFRVRTFSGLLERGASGAPYAQQHQFVNRTWEISPAAATSPVADVTFQWNAPDENAGFRRMTVATYRNDGNAASTWQRLNTGPVSGTGPFTFTATAISTFSQFAIGNAVNPLPVSLTEFTARRVSSRVVLTWSTATEENNARFEVEKSADGRTYRTIGQVAGHGTTAVRQSYQFTDADAAQSAYYRLRQVDANGQATRSAAVFVSATGEQAAPMLYPNPTTGDVTLTGWPADAAVTVALRTAHGHTLVSPSTASVAEANARLSAVLRRAGAGVYLLSVESNGHRYMLKVVKQ
ncbi:T9SS type A sorting domain-containing protein [Hymenobacter busanensis]|uniref:T9SS type A sorting domain-containing protein n=1 Tax=Hymenobacter busanensis TaxID=2607656 RepID=A0A7L4ZV55_9BACT|nr:alpha-amylase family glycosyl hydrolase [Hymenobacter busanensis]KAA9339170.1 T9SS type A sorting domain-containing protein [Hymenobacter busanensis]QHJ07068.1 T9SS type A sorting domain-containing protein [Hymenobacter busanensis]